MASSSASDDSPLPHVPGADMLGSLGSSLVDPLANRPDPHSPSDSDRRRPRPGPTSHPHQTTRGEGDLTMSSDIGQEGPVEGKNGEDSIVVDDDDDVPLPLNKGKAPETVYPRSSSEQERKNKSYVEAPDDAQGVQTPPAVRDEHLGTRVDLAETTASEEGYESSGRATQPESQDASYPSSVFEEAHGHDSAATTSALADQVTSREQKQKQKEGPEAETGSLSGALEDESPFQPPGPGDPGWERSAGRPPQKLPIRFRDAVGRNFLFPWEKAKTWTGMGGLVQSCFLHVDILGPHVMAGRYDLSVNLPFPMDAANEITSPGAPPTPVSTQASTSTAEASGSSTAAGPSNGTGAFNQQQQHHKSSFVVLPELWEDTIEPGMLVVQHMWPFQTPNYITQPVQPSPLPPPQPHHHGLPGGVHPPGRGHGTRGRGRGAGVGTFGGRGGVSGNLFAPPPHMPVGVRPSSINTSVDPPQRGKTRRRQDRR